MLFHKGTTQRQAEAGTRLASGTKSRIARAATKDFFEIAGQHTDTAILHTNLDPIATLS